jgi:hypothetical protein
MTPVFLRSGPVLRAVLRSSSLVTALVLAVGPRAGAQAATQRPTSLPDTVIVWTNIDSTNAVLRSLVDDFAKRIPRVAVVPKSGTRGAAYTMAAAERFPGKYWHIGYYASPAPGDTSQATTQRVLSTLTPVAFLGDFIDRDGVPQWIGLFGSPGTSPELVATMAAIARKSFMGTSANATTLTAWLHGREADAAVLGGVVASRHGFAETPADKVIAGCKAELAAATNASVTADSLAIRVGVIARLAGPGGAEMLAVAAEALSKNTDALSRLDRCAIRARLAQLRS